MPTESTANKPSGDGLGDYAGGSSRSDVSERTAADLGAAFDRIAGANGTATLVSGAEHARVIAAVVALFVKSASAQQRYEVEDTLIYFFAVHGTSPDTEWASYEQQIEFEGRRVAPIEVINVIQLHRLKKFMGHYEMRTIRAVQASAAFRKALMERAARANLQPGKEYMAIDFVGKGGNLSAEEMSTRVLTKDALLNHRARNGANLSTVRRQERLQGSSAEDARAIGRAPLSFD